MVKNKKCDICSESKIDANHENSQKHCMNKILRDYSVNKKKLAKNRNGIIVECDARTSFSTVQNCSDAKVTLSTKPNENVKFNFSIINDNRTDEFRIIFMTLMHNKTNYYIYRTSEQLDLKPNTDNRHVLSIQFDNTQNIGLYEVPILFSFRNNRTSKNFAIVRELAVYVEEVQIPHEKEPSPYDKKKITASVLKKTTKRRHNDDQFRIPLDYKTIFAHELEVNDESPSDVKERIKSVKNVFDIGVSKENYKKYFHNLLWYEEAIVKKNYEDYNMSDVKLIMSEKEHDCYYLKVPGQKLKRPSLLTGELIFIKPSNGADIMFEAVVTMILPDNVIEVRGLDPDFDNYYNEAALFDVRFFLSRLPLERMHQAINNIQNGHERRLFPAKNTKIPALKKISQFFNPLIKNNKEQRTAVEHIISSTSGTAPFLLHGPPGTGKTVTIVEAILQLVLMNTEHQILVCADSNSAADFIANLLVKYVNCFDDTEQLILRASSRFRSWELFPDSLIPYSNGGSREDWRRISITKFMSYAVVVTTLSHAAHYTKLLKKKPRYITHLFIDEAAQASEPACLIPVVGLLRNDGSLILAGDPLQLGPVVISQKAKEIGLGMSLMERLKKYNPLYGENYDPNYKVMLRDNYRSHPDILLISNDLFYEGQLRCKADFDHLTSVDILDEHKKSRAIVFHSVISKEQRVGKSPSFFNSVEFAVLQKYILALLQQHNVPEQDIGVISPYIRQVHKIDDWLAEQGFYDIEVGTVEAFQGKEKRVVIITTVRGKSDLVKNDGKYKLGFLTDSKRFNVAITRAKAKTIVIGNPIILESHRIWKAYIQACRQMGTFLGCDIESLDEQTKLSIVDQITPMLKELVLK